MRLTFDGVHIHEIMDQMRQLLAEYKMSTSKPAPKPQDIDPEDSVQKAKAYMEAPFIAPRPVAKSAEKRPRTEKQLANDERMRVAALAKIAARKADKAMQEAPVPKPAPEPKPEPKPAPAPEPELFADPAEAVKLRQKTIEDLQAAYANGHQQEVFELLSRFGNGAKSFRELPPEAFMPIRDAIDKGALT